MVIQATELVMKKEVPACHGLLKRGSCYLSTNYIYTAVLDTVERNGCVDMKVQLL
jgi:hypothetical protein